MKEILINKVFKIKNKITNCAFDFIFQEIINNTPKNSYPIRFFISKIDEKTITIEATFYSGIRTSKFIFSHNINKRDDVFNVGHIIPTSIGASIGGYAGDATPATRLISSICDTTIVNPNVLNASDILYSPINSLYVEGGLLDEFFLGNIGLRQIKSNRLGIIIEKQPQNYIDYVRYSIDAAHATCGIPIVGYAVTKEKINPRVKKFDSGAYTGEIENIETLLEAAELLILQGATAIAITTEILDLPDLTEYVVGKAPNPHGGIEAIISHIITKKYSIPAAHAPMWGEAAKEEKHHNKYDPREAAELVTNTALGCVLMGLHKAPQPIPIKSINPNDITIGHLSAIVVPDGAIGNIPCLVSDKLGIPIIGVKENYTIQSIVFEHLHYKNYFRTSNYFEAAGMLLAQKEGISSKSIRRPINNISIIE